MYVPEPNTITYVSDKYLVHPVQVYVDMNNQVIRIIGRGALVRVMTK